MTEPFVGEIQLFGFNFAPHGWAHCNGALMPISQNTALFSLLGTQYGGNGTVTFALPDFSGRSACGAGAGPGLTPRTQGERFGADTVTLLQTEMASHSHGVNVFSQGDPDKRSGTPTSGAGLTPPLVDSFVRSPSSLQPFAVDLGFSGGGQPHENRQPYLATNFCIALNGVFPQRP